MERNIGHYDRLCRTGIGTGLLIAGILALAGLFGSATSIMAMGVLFIVIGSVLSVTGITQTCPIYHALEIDTTPPSQKL